MKKLLSFDPPADGMQAFAIDANLFKAYADWKKKSRVTVLGRDVVATPNGPAIFVWYRNPKPRRLRGRVS